MNPLSNVRYIKELNEKEIRLGISEKNSWHNEYKDSAWIFVGGLPFDLTEGDILCVFSQYGEVVNINLVRDKTSGKSKGYCFICFEDQRSTILSVDNFNGIKILNRIIRVDHVANYRIPKERPEDDELTKALRDKGCAPKISSDKEIGYISQTKHIKKEKKEKKKKKKKGSKEFSNDEDEKSEEKFLKRKMNKGHDKNGYGKQKHSSSEDSFHSQRRMDKEIAKPDVINSKRQRMHSKSPPKIKPSNRLMSLSRKRSISPDPKGYYSSSEKQKKFDSGRR